MKEAVLEIVEQGSVRVSSAHIVIEGPGVVCIMVDLNSKRAVLEDIQGDTIYLSANEHTLRLLETVPQDKETVLRFPGYPGWEVFSATGPSRYTLYVTLFDPTRRIDIV